MLNVQIDNDKEYCFTLNEDVTIQSDIIGYSLDNQYFKVYTDGRITFKSGYSWNGATNFFTTRRLIKPTLVHDGIYQIIKLLDIHRQLKWRFKADVLFLQWMLKEKVQVISALLIFAAVRMFGMYFIK